MICILAIFNTQNEASYGSYGLRLQACSKELPQVYHGQRAGNSGPSVRVSVGKDGGHFLGQTGAKRGDKNGDLQYVFYEIR